MNCVIVHCTLVKKNSVHFHDYLNYYCSNQCQTLNRCYKSLSSIHFSFFIEMVNEIIGYRFNAIDLSCHYGKPNAQSGIYMLNNVKHLHPKFRLLNLDICGMHCHYQWSSTIQTIHIQRYG